MSKKKKKAALPKPVNKRLRIIVCLSVALAIVAGSVLTWYLVTKEKPLIVRYNGVMTAKAQEEGYLSTTDVLIVHTVDDSAEGYTTLECYIYRVPDGVSTKRMLKYYAHELPEKWHLEPLGHASAKLLKGDLDSLYAMSVTYVK
jgi:hypothetical protein